MLRSVHWGKSRLHCSFPTFATCASRCCYRSNLSSSIVFSRLFALKSMDRRMMLAADWLLLLGRPSPVENLFSIASRLDSLFQRRKDMSYPKNSSNYLPRSIISESGEASSNCSNCLREESNWMSSGRFSQPTNRPFLPMERFSCLMIVVQYLVSSEQM